MLNCAKYMIIIIVFKILILLLLVAAQSSACNNNKRGRSCIVTLTVAIPILILIATNYHSTPFQRFEA